MYYRLFDTQTGRYMATGYNTTSERELIEAYKSYKWVDWDDEDWDYINDLSVEDMKLHMSLDGFEIEKSEKQFKELE